MSISNMPSVETVQLDDTPDVTPIEKWGAPSTPAVESTTSSVSSDDSSVVEVTKRFKIIQN